MRKKKSKIQENEEALDMYTFPLIVEQKSIPVKEDENKKADAKPSQIRTLSNGLIIQELELGKPDGKIAVSGRKVSISYVGKLKNGEVIDSNVGEVPFKFRLGKGQVINGWDVGLEGMRVGEKRRLTVPPSMGFGSEGHAENIPPNSWLVYDVELVKVR
ncbi:Peptidylprolyl isomerase [Quillaja saponaria]|uniref:peptidylprolyl isomerase n=1 Tax=Quillaja saponaria TaxID=32244 RepID=A0AAD7L2J3_QUISA|nr:Peptidylprolyl isomerase [Quillaja saponaria]